VLKFVMEIIHEHYLCLDLLLIKIVGIINKVYNMKNSKVFIKNNQIFTTPFTLVNGTLVGYVDGNTTTITTTTTAAPSFTPIAVLLTSDTSYTVPTGATSMKAWAVGAGGNAGAYGGAGAGGTAYKTWLVSGGSTVTYACGAAANATVTYGGVTITGFKGATASFGGSAGGSFSGGDGGVNGGSGSSASGGWGQYGGAVGGNSAALISPCSRRPMTDVSGLIAALNLAGVSTTPTCAATTFGSGAYFYKYDYNARPGYGGGAAEDNNNTVNQGGAGVVVLYFS
jgi:hypothetical protein